MSFKTKDNNKLYVIDGSNYFFRAYYAIRSMSNSKSLPTNATYGFIRSILKLIKDFAPTHMVVVFDGPSNEKSRTALYPEYKAHREKMPEDLVSQLPYVQDFCRNYGIPMLISEGVEADDVMGALAKEFSKNKREIFLCSSDKDLCQLINEQIFQLNISKDNLLVTKEKVEVMYGILPSQFIDYLALIGDKSDNIPGVHGIGPKAATNLLNTFNSLEGIYQSIDEISSKGQIEKLLKNKTEAFISQKLATIDQSVPINREITAYALNKTNTQSLEKFYEELEFKTLLKELRAKKGPVKRPIIEYTLIDSAETLSQLEKALKKTTHISFYIDSNQASFMETIPNGIALSLNSDNHYFVPINSITLKTLQQLFTQKKQTLLGANIKYSLHLLSHCNIKVEAPLFDTEIAAYLLQSSSSELLYEELANTLDEKMISCMKSKEIFTQAFQLEKELKKNDLERIFTTVEMPLISILYKMEKEGIFLEEKQLKHLSNRYHKKLKKLTDDIHSLAGETFNINSPKQLSTILFEKLSLTPPRKKKKSTTPSTNIEVLNSLINEHPIIELIINYRSLSKLLTTYIDPLPHQINKNTHRIHPTFEQTVTATGRLSCRDPNLQNIPTKTEYGSAIRNCFMPSKRNHIFCSLDYSQIELRLLAHMSNDEHLVKAFLNDEDIHTATAALIFDLPTNKVTKNERNKAKTVNFAILYGQQAFSLSKELGITVSEAKTFITRYFDKYPKISTFLEKCKSTALKEQMAYSLYGRKRTLLDINSSNKIIQNAALRHAINFPFQSTAADIMKKAMIKISDVVLKKYPNILMIHQIHDELIFEGEEEALHKSSKELKIAMETAVDLIIPLKVDICFGINWGQML